MDRRHETLGVVVYTFSLTLVILGVYYQYPWWNTISAITLHFVMKRNDEKHPACIGMVQTGCFCVLKGFQWASGFKKDHTCARVQPRYSLTILRIYSKNWPVRDCPERRLPRSKGFVHNA